MDPTVEFAPDASWRPFLKENPVASQTNSEKNRALEMALAGIEKQFGKGAIMKLGDAAKMRVEVCRPAP